MTSNPLNFCIFYSRDGYSTANKIMGRQSAGSGFVKGIAQRWPGGVVTAVGADRPTATQLRAQLAASGHCGAVRWHDLAGEAAPNPAAVYYPAPPEIGLAHARNRQGVASYSLLGVTHTLSSASAMDQVARLVLPPFQSWDALICTSHAALVAVERLQDEMRDWMREHAGTTRFNRLRTPVIPLGVDMSAFAATPTDRAAARAALALEADDVAFLFAGRLTFHAKANPAPFYQAVEAACRKTGRALTVVEAGVYPNEAIARAYERARAALAPSVRFVHVDGQDNARYRDAWRASDVFVTLSDNIQETFGLTPLEAMAAGLPVLASDWNGYKDTVRDGIDGYRIPTWLPPIGSGNALALRHAQGTDSYDRYIGRTSLVTAIDPVALAERTIALAEDPALRRRLGEAASRRAGEFDWPVILDRYVVLVNELDAVRRAAPTRTLAWPSRPDPFTLFAHYPTATVAPNWTVRVRDPNGIALVALLDLSIASYGLGPGFTTREAIEVTHHALAKREQSVNTLLASLSGDHAVHALALMWLVKFGFATLTP